MIQVNYFYFKNEKKNANWLVFNVSVGSNLSFNKKVGQVFKVDINNKYQQMLFKIENLTEDTIYRLRVKNILFDIFYYWVHGNPTFTHKKI